MNPFDLIATARDLVGLSARGRPRQSNLRRAVSTAYYALFHCLANCCADMLVGGPGSNRSSSAWNQAYRGLQHRVARQRCQNRSISSFPMEIQYFAQVFVDMQQLRHIADYDPDADYSKADAMQLIGFAEEGIRRFQQAPARDRRAFAVYVLLPTRSN